MNKKKGEKLYTYTFTRIVVAKDIHEALKLEKSASPVEVTSEIKQDEERNPVGFIMEK